MLISNIITEGFYWIMLTIDGIIYSFIDWVYQIIMILAEANILNNNDIVTDLINRVYIIIGVVVLFLVAYSLLKGMVNPDETLKGKESPTKIITNIIVSIALVAFVPTIFDFAMDFQHALLSQNTIGKIILGGTYTDNTGESYESNELITNGGFNMAKDVITAFFHPNYDDGFCSEAFVRVNNGGCSNEVVMSEGWVSDIYSANNQTFKKWWDEDIVARKSFWRLHDANKTVADGKLSYTPIISSAAGILVVIVLFSYCINIAVRLVKIAVLEILAPLPILARIIPKDDVKKVFNNWLKTTISTYLELFIRLAILYFIVFLITLIVDNFSSIFLSGGNNPALTLIAQALVIVGIFLFAKDLPKLIKDITGLDGGKYGLFSGIKQSFSALGAFGALGTGLIRGITNTEKEDGHPIRTGFNRFKNAITGGVKSFAGAAGKEYKNWGDVSKNLNSSVTETIKKQHQKKADKDARKQDLKEFRDAHPQGAHELDIVYKARTRVLKQGDDIKKWAVGGFDAKQQMLDEVNAFLSDTEAIKTTTESLVKDKKFMFTLLDSGIAPRRVGRRGNTFTITDNTTLSQIEAIIQALKNTGDLRDAAEAEKLSNEMQQRIKTIGKEMAKVAVDRSLATVSAFNANYMANGDNIEDKAKPTLETAASQYKIIEQRMVKDSSFDAVTKFNAAHTGGLTPDIVSDLSDELKMQAADLQTQVKLEQERRKSSSGGN